MIDYHLNHVIANGIKYYTDNQDKFRSIFNDVSVNYADKLFTRLNELNVSFNMSYQNKHENFPLITFTIAENADDTENQVLSNRGFGGNQVLFLNQECEISLYADNMDTMRILHRIIQCSMLLFKKNFFNAGYINIEFISSEESEIDDDIISDNVIMFGRKIKYRAQKQMIVEPISSDSGEYTWELSPTII